MIENDTHFRYKDQKKDVEEYRIFLEKLKAHNEKKAKELNGLRESFDKKATKSEKIKLENLDTAKMCIAKVRIGNTIHYLRMIS